jgi:hypothetical protein
MDGCDPILLPLGLYDSKPNEEIEGSSESAVRSIQVGIQALNAEEGEIIEDYMPEGWLYIFVNGFLWHEYEVNSQREFCGIDLRYQQTLDHRTSTGVPSRNIVIPTRMEGEDTEVQIAFSHTQWSWRRILSLGGMNPQDVRYRHWVKDEELLSTIAPKYAFIESYQALSDFNNLSSADDIQVGQWLNLRDADSAIGDSDSARSKRMGKPLSEQAKGSELIVAVQDPLGAVDLMNNAMVAIHLQIKDIVDEINGSGLEPGGYIIQQSLKESLQHDAPAYVPEDHKLYGIPSNATKRDYEHVTQMAQIIYPMLFDETSYAKLDKDAQDYLDKAKNDIDPDSIRAWLHVNQRVTNRDNFRTVQRQLIDYLKSSDNPFDSCSHALNVWDCLEDYAWLPVMTYSQLWSRTNDMLGMTLVDANSQDYSYDLPSLVEQERKEYGDPGLTLFESLLESSHPANSWLFPSSDEVDVYSTDSVEAGDLIEEFEVPTMRVANFQASLNVLLSQHSDENAVTVASLMRKPSVGIPDVVDRFLSILENYKKLANIKDNSTSTIQVDDFFVKFSKSTGMPVLSKIAILEAGQAMDGVVAPGEYRIQHFEKLDIDVAMNRAQKRMATQSQFNGGTPHWIEGFDETGNLISSNTIADLRPYNGPKMDVPEARWTDVFRNRVANMDGTIRYNSKVRMIIAPAYDWTETMSKRLHDWASTKTSLQNAYKSIPSALLILEIFSLGQAVNAVNQSNSNKTSAVGVAAKHAVYIVAATLEAMEAWMGKDGLQSFLKANGKQAGRLAGKNITLTFKGVPLKFPAYRVLGVAVTVIAAVDCAINTTRLAQKHDYDAAIAMGISGLLGLASAGLFFIAANSVAAVAAWIPIWGWILAGVAVLAGIIASLLIDSRFESWAKHCPFAKSHSSRLNHDDYNTLTKLFNQLQDQFFSPSLQLEKQEIRPEVIEVTLTISHPSFINYKSTLEWEVLVDFVSSVSYAGGMGMASNDLDRTRLSAEDLVNKLKRCVLVGPEHQPSGLKLVYEISEQEDKFGFGYSHTKMHSWEAKARHVLPSGLSLPLNNCDNDGTKNDNIGWVVKRWVTD